MKIEDIVGIYQRYKIVIFPVLVGVLSVVIGYTIIYHQISLYISGNDEISRLKDRITRLTTKAQTLSSLDTSNLQTELDTSLTALPADKDLANLIGLIQSQAAVNNVILVTASVGQTGGDPKAKFNPFILTLEVGGSTVNFRNFVNSLEKTPRVMRVATLNVSPSIASSAASATTAVELYYAPTPSEVGAIDAPVPTISQSEQDILDNLSSESTVVPTVGGAPVDSVPQGKANPFQ
jgi:Tfp pilus assembly protein PilO